MGPRPPPPPSRALTDLTPALASASFSKDKRSFKNLLSLLKRPKTNPLPVIHHAKQLPLLPMPLDDAMRPVLSRSHTHSGSLAYLSGDAWVPCAITLHANSISVTWDTHTKDISLLACSDIRSVSHPDDDDLKVFELLFKDPPRTERFAVSTIRERAKWISAFWDAILPSSTSQQLESKRQLDRLEQEVPPPLTRVPTDRSLPPLPPSSRSKSRTLPPTPIAPLNIPSRSRVSFDDTPELIMMPLPPPISPTSAYSSASAPRSRFSYTESPMPTPPSRLVSAKKEWPPPVSRWSLHSQSQSRLGSTDGNEKDTPKRISMFTKVPLDADGVPSHIRAEFSSASGRSRSPPPHKSPSSTGKVVSPPSTGKAVSPSSIGTTGKVVSPPSPGKVVSPPSPGKVVSPPSIGTTGKAVPPSSTGKPETIEKKKKKNGMERANSASITHLSRLSVVKTRLAAMEGAGSVSAPTSPSSRTSSPSSPSSVHLKSQSFPNSKSPTSPLSLSAQSKSQPPATKNAKTPATSDTHRTPGSSRVGVRSSAGSSVGVSPSVDTNPGSSVDFNPGINPGINSNSNSSATSRSRSPATADPSSTSPSRLAPVPASRPSSFYPGGELKRKLDPSLTLTLKDGDPSAGKGGKSGRETAITKSYNHNQGRSGGPGSTRSGRRVREEEEEGSSGGADRDGDQERGGEGEDGESEDGSEGEEEGEEETQPQAQPRTQPHGEDQKQGLGLTHYPGDLGRDERGDEGGRHRAGASRRLSSRSGVVGAETNGHNRTSREKESRGTVINRTSATTPPSANNARTVADGLPDSQSTAITTTPRDPNAYHRIAEVVTGIQAVQRTLGSGEGEETLYSVIKGIGERVDGVKGAVEGMERAFIASQAALNSEGKTNKGAKEEEEKEEEVRVEVKKGLASVHAKMEEIVRLHRDAGRSGGGVEGDKYGQDIERVKEGVGEVKEGVGEMKEGLGEMKESLDALAKASRETQKMVGDAKLGMARDSKNVLAEIAHLTSLLTADHAHREVQSAQQADSVRYLNELNGWLEAFVGNGTSHIQALASSVDKLYMELAPPGISGGDGNENKNGSRRSTGQSLLYDVRQLVLGMKARDQSMAGLQAAVNDLVVSVGAAGVQKSSGGLDANALAHMIDAQRREQEAMLRVFTDEISDEIKGERLRFVEAMKEATAINVQHHVEELKKEMGKEVFVMAQEVERLHRDKQEVEQRIAELMAFYSKQSTPGGSINRSTHTRFKSGFESTGSHTHAIGQAPPGMLAMSSEPAYVRSSVEKYFDFEKQGPNGDASNNPAGPGNQARYIQGPSSSLDSRPQQYSYRPTFQYQDAGNGTEGGVDGAHAAGGLHSNYYMTDESALKPVVDLRMRPLGSSGGGGEPSRSGSGREAVGRAGLRGSGVGGSDGSTQVLRQQGSTTRGTARPGAHPRSQRAKATTFPMS